MTTYKMKLTLTQTVLQEYWEEFDTSDQEKWTSVRESAAGNSAENIYEQYPKEAPDDPAIWYELYKHVYYGEYEEKEEDFWVSDCNGSTEYSYELLDEDDDIVMSDCE